MQDLTSGSIGRHLLKTTGFMLVTMIFQTLYVRWIWYLSAASIVVQVALNLGPLRREFRRRLDFDVVPERASIPAPTGA